MKSRFIAAGALLGIAVGTFWCLLFPNLLPPGLKFNGDFNQASGYPRDFYSIKAGSVYNVFPLLVLFFGLLGGIAGLIFFKTVLDKRKIRCKTITNG